MIARLKPIAVALACAPSLVCLDAAAEDEIPSFTPTVAFKTAAGISDALSGNAAAELDFDFGFNWRAANNTTVVLNLETRNGMTDARLADVSGAMDSLTGVADGTTGGPLFRLEKFWVRHEFTGSGANITLGRLHFEDHFLDNALSSKSAAAFANEIFSAKPGVAFPRDAMGAAVVFRFGDRVRGTLLAGDAHRERELDVFASGEVFGAGELSALLGPFGLGRGNYRIGFWSRSIEDSADFGEAGGVGVSIDQPFGEGETLMLRYFRNEGGLRPAEEGAALAVSGDAGFLGRAQDQIGLGFGVLRPIDPLHERQITVEAYYRLQASDAAAITPTLQYVANDGGGATRGESIYTGVRLRLRRPD